jgi:uncharacterized protein YjbI with pentapeptide repeats
MKIEIKSRWNADRVIYSADIPDETPVDERMRLVLEKAAKEKADLSGADLSGAVLSDAVLSGADLSGADLSGAVLSGADLSGADLSDAVLRDAVLRGADLSGAVLSDAVLSGADLSGADLSGAVLSGADLSGADLSDAVLSGADLSGADLSGAVLSGAVLRGADLRGAVLSGAVLRGAVLSGAVLSGAVLRDADLSGAIGGININTDAKPLPRATPEQAIENLDKVREIIIDNADRLDMGVWHHGYDWKDRTCAEEAVCGTAHCLAGWLQVCATDPTIRTMDPHRAGILQAPIASKMFFRSDDVALEWLRDRKYVAETEKRLARDAARAARKAQAQA